MNEALEGDDPSLSFALNGSDIDDVIREVDRRADDQDWPALGRLIVRARAAHDRGRQFWPASTYASHRMALDGPADWAAAAVMDGVWTLGLGPLAEVAAVNHSWEQIEPWLPLSAERYVVAHERGLRNDDGVAATETDRRPSDIDPFGHSPVVADWEVGHVAAAYTSWSVEAPRPGIAHVGVAEGLTVQQRKWPAEPPSGCLSPDDLAVPGRDSLYQLVAGWDGEGVQRLVIGGAGSAADAVDELGWDRSDLVPCGFADVVADWTWAAASGGPKGRRRGGATGRFDALWAAASVLGMEGDWPIDSNTLGAELATLEFWSAPGGAWGQSDPSAAGPAATSSDVSDWRFGWIVADPAEGLAWGIRCWVDR